MDLTPDSAAAQPDRRLNGWKEIAAHFGRGVRTVQRWEKELGMPVRRVAGARNDSVTASVRELDAWWTDTLQKSNGLPEALQDGEATERPVEQPDVADDAHPEASRSRWTWQRLLPAIVIVAMLVAAAAWGLWPVKNPARAALEHGKVHVYAEDGTFLWEAPTGVLGAEYGGEALNALLVRDLEGDGSNEVLIGLGGTETSPGRLFCFEANGRQRFVHHLNRVVRFGDQDFRGPWNLHLATTTDITGRRGTILWVAFNHYNYFTTVLQRLDSRGKVLGEYWSDGNIADVKAFVSNGKARILVGAANNDFRSASLAVLDPDFTGATAPARQHEFTCQGCPASHPPVFLVFPTTDVERIQECESAPKIIVSDGRGISILLRHDAGQALGHVANGHTTYTFDANLEPLHAEREPSFKMVYDELFAAKKVDHPFGAAEQASAWPMIRWNGRDFEPLRPR
jgi:hypothetical protein